MASSNLKPETKKHLRFDAIGGYLPLSKVYESPTSAGQAEVLGIQGQLWSEPLAVGVEDRATRQPARLFGL